MLEYENVTLRSYICVEFVVRLKLLAGYVVFDTFAAVKFPRTTTDWIAACVVVMTSLSPVYRFTFSTGLGGVEWPVVKREHSTMKEMATSVQLVFFNQPPTC